MCLWQIGYSVVDGTLLEKNNIAYKYNNTLTFTKAWELYRSLCDTDQSTVLPVNFRWFVQKYHRVSKPGNEPQHLVNQHTHQQAIRFLIIRLTVPCFNSNSFCSTVTSQLKWSNHHGVYWQPSTKGQQVHFEAVRNHNTDSCFMKSKMVHCKIITEILFRCNRHFPQKRK